MTAAHDSTATPRDRMAAEHDRGTAACDSEAAQRCQDVHDSADGVLASLADYGMDAARLTAFQALIDAYLTENTAPRLAITKRNNATAEIEKLVDGTLTMLNRRLDPLM